MTWSVSTGSPEDTQRLGYLLGQVLLAGDILSLDGDLGAGKTALTQGIAAGLRCEGLVASPTFTLLMEHAAGPGGLALYHFDVYRLRDAEAFYELGLDEYFDAGGVCVIEWGQLIRDALPARTITLGLHQAVGCHHPDQRLLSLVWPVPADSQRLDNLRKKWETC